MAHSVYISWDPSPAGEDANDLIIDSKKEVLVARNPGSLWPINANEPGANKAHGGSLISTSIR